MAGNNSIQILRGNNVKTNSSINGSTLLDGQPLYDRATGYLFVGEGNTIANTTAVNAHYANSAGTASSATIANTRQKLYFNGNGTNVSWNGSSVDTIYVPTSVGSSGQVWGMRSNGTVGWIAQTEIPGTIDHANTANVAYEVSGSNVAGTVSNANYSNYANTAYRVSGSNVSGSVANANYANVAGKVENNLNIRVAGTNYTFNGEVSANLWNNNLVATTSALDIGAILYVSTNGTTSTPASYSWLAKGVNGQVLTATSTGIAWGSMPDEKYWFFAQDTGRALFFMYSTGTSNPGTNFLNLIMHLYNSGYNSSNNPLPAIGFDADNKCIRGIYAPTRYALTIMHTDGTTYNRDVSAGLAIQVV